MDLGAAAYASHDAGANVGAWRPRPLLACTRDKDGSKTESKHASTRARAQARRPCAPTTHLLALGHEIGREER